MSNSPGPVRKITITLPVELVDYADDEAERLRTSRSQIIAQALAERQAAQREILAADGYRFYAEESAAYAESTGPAVSEVIDDDRPPR